MGVDGLDELEVIMLTKVDEEARLAEMIGAGSWPEGLCCQSV